MKCFCRLASVTFVTNTYQLFRHSYCTLPAGIPNSHENIHFYKNLFAVPRLIQGLLQMCFINCFCTLENKCNKLNSFHMGLLPCPPVVVILTSKAPYPPSPYLWHLCRVPPQMCFPFITTNRHGVSCSLPHTSLISPLDMLDEWKSVSFSRVGI